MMTVNDIRETMLMVARRDPRAVPALRELASRINAIADQLESAHNGTESTGGIGDVVRMKLVGPDGTVKHDTIPSAN